MAGSTLSWEGLQGAIGGAVVLAGSPAYERLHPPFNARFDPVRPQAVVRCATPRTSPPRSGLRAGTGWRRRHEAAGTTSLAAPCLTGW